jgi:type VI secretion system secreted protein VgrG
MPQYLQTDRAIKLFQPAWAVNLLFPVAFDGREAISELFTFDVSLIADNGSDVPFEKLLGQRLHMGLELADGGHRYFTGIVSRISQGKRDATFTPYRLQVVPQFWFLTRRSQSRIFQHQTVPEILKAVLQGLDVDFEIRGEWQPRDYCVQYRETDFAFASRLMEEEGIYYYFTHSANAHRMVLANTPAGHRELPGGASIHFDEVEGGTRPDMRIFAWEKRQELRSGRCTLWDHHFELPHKHLEADKATVDVVPVGEVNHRLKIGQAERLELYDFPGGYAHRFDGVDRGGGDQPNEVQKIFTDNGRTVEIRMQAEATPALRISGSSNHRQLVPGFKFALTHHFNADGPYVLESVTHKIRLPANYRSGEAGELLYENEFECLPFALPYRPARDTERPVIQGSQTAVVVGPKTEEIFTDKYGRVKVQFHWDRQGKYDEGSSCWVRVGQLWAGRRWGASFWPRVGQEVIVTFLEGDPDQPIIVGSVYNADQMPPYLGEGPDRERPHHNQVSGIKSNTTPGGHGFNELRFDDTRGKEQVFLHGQRNFDVRVENDCLERIKGNRHRVVGVIDGDKRSGGDQFEANSGEKHIFVDRHHIEQINGDMKLLIGGGIGGLPGGNQDIVVKAVKKEHIEAESHLIVDKTRSTRVGAENLIVNKDRHTAVGGDEHLHVDSDLKQKVDGSVSLTVGSNYQEKTGAKHALHAGNEIHLQSGGTIVLEATTQLTIKGPGGFITIDASGVTIQGTLVKINSGGAAGSGSGSDPDVPKDPADPMSAEEAEPSEPSLADNAVTGRASSGNN